MENSILIKDHVVMTPKSKTARSTTLTIERKSATESLSSTAHIGGGDHQGIIISKEIAKDVDTRPPQASLEFRVFLVDAQNGKNVQEKRLLQYWFAGKVSDLEQTALAQEFFKALVSPQEFPRDYVGFIKKVMKLLQHGFSGISKLDVTLTQLDSLQAPPTRPSKPDAVLITLGYRVNQNSPVEEARPAEVLELIEAAYPNPVTVDELAGSSGRNVTALSAQLAQLQSKGLVQALDNGAFTRANEARVVKQIPTMSSSKQPTIAVITSRYAAKMAVDALMENKETFVRYTTVGESNVYTLGNMGAHRIVCTKLPGTGHSREAATAAGNAITRLLGTFQKVDFVVLVGVAGGVPHYADFSRHVRLGDVVASYPNTTGAVYLSCDAAPSPTADASAFDVRTYSPSNLVLQNICLKLKEQGAEEWLAYLEDGLNSGSEQDFTRPPPESDKLLMSVGEHDLIEVEHPSCAEDACRPRLHLSAVASSRAVACSDVLRHRFADTYGVLALDSELDAAVESVIGNRRDSFLILRGIADYKDGGTRRDWQPFAALAAASVMKAVICAMEPLND